MPLLLKTHFELAKSSLRENRNRSLLTCLGIAIGIASIILILSLMGSINNLITRQITEMGEDIILVQPSSKSDAVNDIVTELTSTNQYQTSILSLSDVDLIKKIDDVEYVAPIATATNTVSGENTLESVTVLGTNEDFANINQLSLHYGTFLKDKNTNTAVIGHSLSLKLFGTSNPVSQTFSLGDQRFIIIGVLSAVDDSINFNHIDFDNTVIINAYQLQQYNPSLQIQQILVRATNTDSLAKVSSEIQASILNAKNGNTNFKVSYGDQITHPAGSLLNIVSGMLALVAGISLIVGGIGVMNIMLVSVAEREHEIGIRKATGASGRNILSQFLFEAIILSLVGGFMGLLLGYALAFVVSIITPFVPYISWPILAITFATSFTVGILFGLYPAIKAASKNPIDSLKHYR